MWARSGRAGKWQHCKAALPQSAWKWQAQALHVLCRKDSSHNQAEQATTAPASIEAAAKAQQVADRAQP